MSPARSTRKKLAPTHQKTWVLVLTRTLTQTIRPIGEVLARALCDYLQLPVKNKQHSVYAIDRWSKRAQCFMHKAIPLSPLSTPLPLPHLPTPSPFPPSAVNEREWVAPQCCSAKMTQVLGLLLTSQASWLAGAIPNSKMQTSNMNPTLSTDHRIRLLAAQKSSDTRFWGPISRLRPRAEDSETHAAATVRLRRGA